jgi:hypothetical protein
MKKQRTTDDGRPSTDPLPGPGDVPIGGEGGSSTEAEIGTIAPAGRSLVMQARRSRDYNQEGAVKVRVVDVALYNSPKQEWLFRAWPDEKDYLPVATIRVDRGVDRKETYVVTEEVAGLPFLAGRVRDADLVPCITSKGMVFVWSVTVPNPDDRFGYRNHSAMRRILDEARGRWVSIRWANGKPSLAIPKVEIAEPHWPDQPCSEIYELALKDRLISDPASDVIRELDRIIREVE